MGDVASDSRVARSLRGFGPLSILLFLIMLLAGPNWFRGLLVLAWARCSDTPWRELGYVRPKSWVATIIGALAFGAVLKLLMKALVMPLLGADPINYAYHYLAGNCAALPGMLFIVTIGAGFGEETVFRAYLFERFRRLFGHGAAATAGIVLLTSAIFASAHYLPQGIYGVEQALITGLVFGTIFARTRAIWFPMIAHAAFDITAVAIIYYNLETKIAHLVFK